MLDEVCAAVVPVAGLAALAALRTRAGLTAQVEGERVWVRWPAGEDEVRACLLPVPGVVFYARRGGQWFRLGSRLPSPDAWEGKEGPLAALLTPAALSAQPDPPRQITPVRVTLVRDSRPRPVRALSASLVELGRWAESAPTSAFAGLEGAVAGAHVVLRGEPGIAAMTLVDAVRYWGQTLVCPLGFRPEPALPQRALAGALGLAEGDLGLLTDAGLEVVPAEAFGPLSRAGVRLAVRGPG